MSALDRFVMIGTRLTACDFREDNLVERIKSDGNGGSLEMGFEVSYTVSEAEISKGSIGSRNVIEVPFTFRLNAHLRGGKEPIELGQVCELSFVSGFVGRAKENDGDLTLFADCADTVSRTVFWSVRTYIQGFINVTLMRNVPIPWDLTPESKGTKRAAKKAAKSKLAKAPSGRSRAIAGKTAKPS
jgi:hypothetical protein